MSTASDIANTVTNNATTPAQRNADGTMNTQQAQQSLNTNYSDFLKLLTTQLTHQDPTAPVDTNQITQEIASLSQVEQLINWCYRGPDEARVSDIAVAYEEAAETFQDFGIR